MSTNSPSKSPTRYPTYSPSNYDESLAPLYTMLIVFILIVVMIMMCVFLTHSKNVAKTHQVLLIRITKSIEDLCIRKGFHVKHHDN